MAQSEFSFEPSSLEGWGEIAGPWESEAGQLKIAASGNLTQTIEPAESLTLSLSVDFTSRTNLKIQFSTYLFRIGEGAGERWTIERDGRLFSEQFDLVEKPLGKHLVTATADKGEVSLTFDGKRILAAKDPLPPPMRQVVLSVGGATNLGEIKLAGRSSQNLFFRRKQIKPEFEYQVTADYPDDIWLAEGQLDEANLREMMRIYADWGVKRIHWMHYGGRDGGMFDRGRYVAFGEERAYQFHQEMPEPLTVVTDECHRLGVEVYGIFKACEDAIGMPYANATDNEPPPPSLALKFVGGRPEVSYRFVRDHPELQMTRHPAVCPHGEPGPIDEIYLYHQNDEPLGLSAKDFRLWVSEHNDRYEPYAGELKVEEEVIEYAQPRFAPAPEKRFSRPRPCRRFRLSGMRLSQRFIVVEIDPEARSEGTANFLEALVEIRSAGSPVLFTYGLAPVQRVHQQQDHDWRNGIAFDAARQTVVVYGRGLCEPQSAGRFHYTLGAGGWIGIGVGRNRHPMGVTDPSFPEVRAWWLSRIEDMIRAGVDGVDIRLTTHTENLDWENYSFSPPIVEEFKRRYGVDIIRKPFSREAWRRLRGEYYDTFLKQASEVLHRAGGRLQFHLHRWLEFEPDGNTFMETAWNWREWIRQRVVDEILMRGPDFHDPLFHIVQKETAALDMPCYVSKPVGPQVTDVLEFIRRCQDAGMDGVNLYESCSLLRRRADGELAVSIPSVPEALRAARQPQK